MSYTTLSLPGQVSSWGNAIAAGVWADDLAAGLDLDITGATLVADGGPGVGLPDALSFDGSDDHAEYSVSNEAQLNLGASGDGRFWIAFWVRRTAEGSSFDQVVGKGNSNCYLVRRSTGATRMLGEARGGTGGDVAVDADVATGVDVWRFVVVQQETDADRIAVYAGGPLVTDDVALINSASRSGTVGSNTDAKFVIGAQDNHGTVRRWFPGRIAGVRIGTGAQLSLSQMQELFEASFVEPASGDTFTGTLDADLPALASALTGTSEAPAVSTGTLAADLPTLGADLTGASAVPTYTGTLAGTLASLAASLTGTHAEPEYTGTLASSLPTLAADLSGTHIEPGVEGTLDAPLPSLSANLEGASSLPLATGTLDTSLPSLASALTGTSEAPVFDGDLAASLPTLEGSLSGGFASVVFEGALGADLPTLAANLTGAHSIPDSAGVLDAALPSLGSTLVGESTVPVFAGVLDADLPGLTSSLFHRELLDIDWPVPLVVTMNSHRLIATTTETLLQATSKRTTLTVEMDDG